MLELVLTKLKATPGLLASVAAMVAGGGTAVNAVATCDVGGTSLVLPGAFALVAYGAALLWGRK